VSGIGTSSRRICAFGFLLRQLEQQQWWQLLSHPQRCNACGFWLP
jgi:hypothetical protein